MTSKKRWTLMPRKWFGSLVNAAQKRDQEKQSQLDYIVSTSTLTIPKRTTGRNPTFPSSANNSKPSNLVTQFQLPAFNVRHGKTSTVLPIPTIFSQTTAFGSIRQEATIREHNPSIEPLSIYTRRSIIRAKVHNPTDTHVLPRISTSRDYSSRKQSDASEHQCLLDSGQNSPRRCSKHSSSISRTHSSSSMDNNDSLSSGIFSDQQTDSIEHHPLPSKDTLSKLENLSTESLNESHTTPIPPYRLSIPSFETTDKPLSYQTLNQSTTIHFHRVQSAERILKDNENNRQIITKSRQSSAAIIKKIEKRLPIHRPPSNTLEKTNFIRITNDTYRLTSTRENQHFYRRHRPNSVIQHSIYDDSLPSANNEDSYAELPRTSSTEQLDKNLQNDLRAIVESIDHSIISSSTTPENPNAILENITDKLLSSMDSSIYAQYERCY
ncbi:hypothetical protein I4U23_018327 [Adineta vaga]|nr:hypothetical protein I4U23_018327 [Adineta vaga]